MNAFLKYTAARTLLLVASYAALWALLRLKWQIAPLDPFVLLAAIVVSAVVALFALRGLRADVARTLEERATKRAARLELSRESDEIDRLD